jgi:hypothetical protein
MPSKNRTRELFVDSEFSWVCEHVVLLAAEICSFLYFLEDLSMVYFCSNSLGDTSSMLTWHSRRSWSKIGSCKFIGVADSARIRLGMIVLFLVICSWLFCFQISNRLENWQGFLYFWALKIQVSVEDFPSRISSFLRGAVEISTFLCTDLRPCFGYSCFFNWSSPSTVFVSWPINRLLRSHRILVCLHSKKSSRKQAMYYFINTINISSQSFPILR